MRSLPLGAGTVIIVGVHLMIVHVHSRQQRRPRRTAHRRSDVSMPEFRTLIPDRSHGFRHEIHRAEFDVLIIGEDQDNVGFRAVPGKCQR